MEVEDEAGVPRLYGVTTDSPPSLVMELCPGEPLEHCLRRGELRSCLLASCRCAAPALQGLDGRTRCPEARVFLATESWNQLGVC